MPAVFLPKGHLHDLRFDQHRDFVPYRKGLLSFNREAARRRVVSRFETILAEPTRSSFADATHEERTDRRDLRRRALFG
jgi:hypothetical protein